MGVAAHERGERGTQQLKQIMVRKDCWVTSALTRLRTVFIMLTFNNQSSDWKSHAPINFVFKSDESNWNESVTANAYDVIDQGGNMTVKLQFNLNAERPEYVVPQVGALMIHSREILVGIRKQNKTDLLNFSGDGASRAMQKLFSKLGN